MPLAVFLLFAGILLAYMGVTNESLEGILTDNHVPLQNPPSGGSTPSGNLAITPTQSPSGKAIGSIQKGFPGFSQIVGINPVPGASGGRLDQGFDVTGNKFLAPYNGKVVYSTQSDPGWKGGGYVAIANAIDPNQVTYFAEGIIPIVKQGDNVVAGQRIAVAAPNPYNGTPGNIEFGPANPANPRQPLAQVSSNPAAVVQRFYNWILALGGPKASSTSNIGRP